MMIVSERKWKCEHLTIIQVISRHHEVSHQSKSIIMDGAITEHRKTGFNNKSSKKDTSYDFSFCTVCVSSEF